MIIDVAVTLVLLPAGQPANYWIWADTPEDVRPADYSDYKYMYNEAFEALHLCPSPMWH